MLTVFNIKDAAQIPLPPRNIRAYQNAFSYSPEFSSALINYIGIVFNALLSEIDQMPCMNISSVLPLGTQSLVDSAFTPLLLLAALFLSHCPSSWPFFSPP